MKEEWQCSENNFFTVIGCFHSPNVSSRVAGTICCSVLQLVCIAGLMFTSINHNWTEIKVACKTVSQTILGKFSTHTVLAVLVMHINVLISISTGIIHVYISEMQLHVTIMND